MEMSGRAWTGGKIWSYEWGFEWGFEGVLKHIIDVQDRVSKQQCLYLN